MNLAAKDELPSLIRGAIGFVYSRIRGRRLALMLVATALMLLGALITVLPPLLLGQIVTKSTTSDCPTPPVPKPSGFLDSYDFFPRIKHIASFDDVIPYLLLLGALIL